MSPQAFAERRTMLAEWYTAAEAEVLKLRPDAAGRIHWPELQWLRQVGRTPAGAAATYVLRHDELVKYYPAETLG